jgi:hypothetical protein
MGIPATSVEACHTRPTAVQRPLTSLAFMQLFRAAVAALIFNLVCAFIVVPVTPTTHLAVRRAGLENDDAQDTVTATKRASVQTVNDRLLDEINTALPKTRIYEGAMRMEIQREEVDLNGVQPAMAFLGSAGAAAMSAAAWKMTNVLAVIYLTQSQQYAASDILIVQRLTGTFPQHK